VNVTWPFVAGATIVPVSEYNKLVPSESGALSVVMFMTKLYPVMSIGKFVDKLMIVSKSLCVLPRLRLIIAMVAPIKYLVK
jgi:hypothetical protein